MLKKFMVTGLLATMSLNVFAESKELKSKINKEQIMIELDASCKTLAKSVVDSLKNQQAEATKEESNSSTAQAMKIRAKHLANINIDCEEVSRQISILSDQLGEAYLPGGIFLVGGAEVNSPAAIPFIQAFKTKFSPGYKFLVGAGVMFQIKENGRWGVKPTALALSGLHISSHLEAKRLGVFGKNYGVIVPFRFNGEVKSIENFSGIYGGVAGEVGISNNKITNTSGSMRMMAPLSIQDSRVNELNINDLLSPSDLVQKLSSVVSAQKPILGFGVLGKGNDSDVGQITLDGAFVHAVEL